MSIDTTLNIHKTIMEQIKFSTEVSGLTNNEIIIRLFHRAIKEYPKLYHKGTRRIKYQERDEEKRWMPKHVYFTEIEYEVVNDIKKLYKMSISNILAFAVRNFLKKELYEIILQKTINKSDNNRFSCYVVVMELIDNVICWKFYWGIPRNLARLLPISKQ